MDVHNIQFIKTWTSMVLKRVKHGRPQLENLDAHVIPIEKYGRSNADHTIRFHWPLPIVRSEDIALSFAFDSFVLPR